MLNLQKDKLIAMQTSSQGDELLTISEFGIGRREPSYRNMKLNIGIYRV